MTDFDGVVPTHITRVNAITELAELLDALNVSPEADRLSVVPVGGGTATGIGNIVSRIDHAIDLRGLRGIEDYNPSDLTLRVYAGTTLAELQGELAQHGQELPIDIPFPDRATIGGVIATAFAGPRRYGSGTMKDAIIGASFVRGDGLSARAGGMVVKNVSGFEMSRFLHGSWGTLAVIASANLKIAPIPKAERTLSTPFANLDAAMKEFRNAVAAGVRPAAAEMEVRGDEVVLHVRLLGGTAGVDTQEIALERSLVRLPEQRRDGEGSKAFWQTLTETWAESPNDEVQVAVGVRARESGEIAARLMSSETGIGSSSLLVSPGTGTIRARFSAASIAPTDLWARLAFLRTVPGSSAFVEFAPVEWRRQVDVWGPPPVSIAMMKAVKREFDPHGLLNRGRMMI